MRRWATVLTIAMVAAVATGQATTPPAPAAPAAPAAGSYFQGEVTGQDVFVRSSNSSSAYHCTKLSSPARVTVVGSDTSKEWYKILPPPGCYSVISKAHVRLNADGQTGTVTGNDVWARAGGLPDLPGNFSILQKAMKAGDRVRVLGPIGENYKIEPPRGAHFYISAKFVKKLAGAATPRAGSDPPEVPLDPSVIKYQALHKEMLAEWKKPSADRDYLAMAAKFEALKMSKASGLQSFVDGTAKFLKQQHQRRLDWAAAAKVTAAAGDVDAQLRAKLARLALGSATKPAGAPTARGIVTVSAVYPGCPAIGRRLVLRDDKSLRIKAYLQESPGGESLLACVGMLVGVHGPSRHDSNLGMTVVQVQRVEVLAPMALVPAVPQATLAPIEVKTPAATQPATTQPAATRPATTQPAS